MFTVMLIAFLYDIIVAPIAIPLELAKDAAEGLAGLGLPDITGLFDMLPFRF